MENEQVYGNMQKKTQIFPRGETPFFGPHGGHGGLKGGTLTESKF